MDNGSGEPEDITHDLQLLESNLLIDDQVLLKKFRMLRQKTKFTTDEDYFRFLLEQDELRQTKSLDAFFDQFLYPENKDINIKLECSEFNTLPAVETHKQFNQPLGLSEDNFGTFEGTPDVKSTQGLNQNGECERSSFQKKRKKIRKLSSNEIREALDDDAMKLFEKVNRERKSKLFRHKRTKFDCRICPDMKNLTFANLRIHYTETHPGSKPFRCDPCNLDFNTYGSLYHHTRTRAHGTVEASHFKCDVCGKQFANYYAKKKHMRLHTGELLKCGLCGRGFTDASGLRTHHQGVHLQDKKFHCETCGKQFLKETYLNAHKLRHEGRTFNCDVCGKQLSSEKILSRHKVKHLNLTRDYICAICGHGFKTPTDLRMHQRLHNPVKRFGCEYCQKRFRTGYMLKIHVRMHNGERPFVCEVCSKGFRSRTILKKHTIIHTNERPYKCKNCPSDFNNKAALYTHLKMHNNSAKIDQHKPIEMIHTLPPPPPVPMQRPMEPPRQVNPPILPYYTFM